MPLVYYVRRIFKTKKEAKAMIQTLLLDYPRITDVFPKPRRKAEGQWEVGAISSEPLTGWAHETLTD